MIGAQRSVNSGFTLLEMMVVVVVLGFLVLVAFPSYQGYIVKANRAETQSYLMQLSQRQQQFFSDARRYANGTAQLNVDEPERVADNYVVTFAQSSINQPPWFLITATPRAGTAQAQDGVISIDNTGTRLLKGEPW